MGVTDGVRASVDAGVMEIVLNNPPSNAIEAAQRQALIALLAAPPAEVHAVMLRAEGRSFASDGALSAKDMAARPDLAALCRAVEDCTVPVFAVLQGLASGAGAELALACHARLATPTARLAFPAARLGLVCGAGGTQRLPRLIGAAQALRLMQGGAPVLAAEALALGLVDEVIEADSPEAALAMLRERLANRQASGQHPSARTAAQAEGRGFWQAISAARAALSQQQTTLTVEPLLIDCLEAALLLPYEQGLNYEATIAQETARTSEAAALIHLHLAEHRAAETPSALAKLPPNPVRRLAVAGGEPVLAGLLLTALSRGISVGVAERDRDRLVALLQAIAARQEAAVQAGTLTPAQRDADWARLTPVADLDAVGEADLVILGSDDLNLPASLRAKTVLMMGRAPLAEGALRLVVSGRVAELGLPVAAPAQPTAQALMFLRRLGLNVVLTGAQTPLGLAGRLSLAGGAAVQSLLRLGVAAEAVTEALSAFGQRLPPLHPPADVAAARAMAPSEIVQRWLSALANEGTRLLAAGMAQSPLDIDLVAVSGLGFPRAKGGPMHQAESRGLLILRRDLTQWGAEGDVWKPVPALDALVSAGRGFERITA
jgi:3-hydroxyacyl-CoA dehydrogenase